MKKRLVLFKILILLAVNHTCSSQIQLAVPGKGDASISINGKKITAKECKLPVRNGQVISFDFSNIKNPNAIFSVKGEKPDNTNVDFMLDSSYFNKHNDLSTDEALNIVMAGKKVSLNQPLHLFVSDSKNSRTMKSCRIVPVLENQPAVAQPRTNLNNRTDDDIAPVPAPYQPGSMILDALKLTDNKNLSTNDLMQIIQFYYRDTLNDISKVMEKVNSNPFLKAANLKADKPDTTAGAHSGAAIFSSLSFSSIGGLDVTNLADGLAKFIVKRTKQELTIAFFQKFKDALDSTKDLGTLFPQTAYLLHVIDNEIYDYQRYIQNLQAAFKEDIAALPKNLPGIIDNHPSFFNQHKELDAALRSACYLADGVENHVHPGDIIEGHPVKYLEVLKSKNYKAVIQTLQLLNYSLKDTTTGEDASYWVSLDKVKKVLANPRASSVYFGLLYQTAAQRYDSVLFDNGHTLTGLMRQIDPENLLSTHNAYKDYIMGFENKLELINKMIKGYSRPASDSAAVELYAQYLKTTVDIFEYSLGIARLPLIDKTTIGARIGSFEQTLWPYFNISDAVADMSSYVVRRNYSGTINKAVYVYNEILAIRDHKKDADVKTGEPGMQALSGTVTNRELVHDAEATGTDPEKAKSTLNSIIKYGGVMASIATAKTSDEVEQAIETYALPVGSSRIKKNSNFNIALNAYAGLYIGSEKIGGVDDNYKIFNAYGVTAPIGLSISKGIATHTKNAWSTSLFFSIIDIGAPVAFRFKDDKTEQIPTIQLKDIVSPGIFFSVGLPQVPISVNAGWQMGPVLRKLDPAVAGKASSNYSRISISFLVDIPLFNFYTSSR